MESSDIEKLMQQRQSEIKDKKNQLGYGFVLIFTVVIFCMFLWKCYYTYAVCLGVGMTIGITLRYSRFCFAAAFRNLFVTGNTRVLRGILLGLIVSTIGFAIIQSGYSFTQASSYSDIPGVVSSVGLHSVIGAFIFGIGMVLAGGCASGILMRIGEGHTIHGVALVGLMIGTLLGAKDYNFWHNLFIKNAKVIYFPEYLDIKIVVFIQVVVLMILYKLALWYEKDRLLLKNDDGGF